MRDSAIARRGADRRPRSLKRRPRVEGLEDRLLLWATSGGEWVHAERVTFSFAPDGTPFAGVASSLNAAMAARGITTTAWQDAFRKAAATWQAVAGVNLVQVTDSGAAFGVAGNQQGDGRFGDIRIGGVPQAGSVLATSYLPPPFNGGTLAGDIVLNTSQTWNVNSTYDVLTVAIHEIGHSLGMGHSAVTSASLYAYYNAQKQALTGDDTAGIQSVYGARAADAFESNNTTATATNITPYINGNLQVALSGLDITTATDTDYFRVTVPAGTTGTMTVSMQSAGLSSLSPRLLVGNAAWQSIGSDAKANTYGATATVTIAGVTAGQVYGIRAMTANAGVTGVGGYGLLVNFGSAAQSPIAPPVTVVVEQADQGGGSSGEHTGPGAHRHGPTVVAVPAGRADQFGVAAGRARPRGALARMPARFLREAGVRRPAVTARRGGGWAQDGPTPAG